MKTSKERKAKSNVKNVYEKPDGRWVVMYRDKAGKQHMEYFGRGDDERKRAEAFALHVQAEMRLGKKPDTKGPQVYFEELAQKYLNDRRMYGVSEMTVYSLKRMLNEHGIGAKLNKKPVDQLIYTDVTEAIENEYKDRSLSTKQRYLGYLRAIFNFGVRTKMTKSNPLDMWKKTDEPERQMNLTVEDLMKIMDASPYTLLHRAFWPSPFFPVKFP